jgi:hypothetical protein
VPSQKYRLSTLDGWALRRISALPTRSKTDPRHLLLNSPKEDYPAIRRGILTLLGAGHLSDLLSSNYSRLIVDEYQDCSPPQHEMVLHLADHLDTVVLGDPLQAIFGFTPEGVVDWNSDVIASFPEIGKLETPWRWILADNEELGNWLLEIREQLLAGETIDLQLSPDCVDWVQLSGDKSDMPRRIEAANTPPPTIGGGTLIMASGKRPGKQAEYARKIPGASKVENSDLSDLVYFAQSFVPGQKGALGLLVDFAEAVVTSVDRTTLKARLNSIAAGTNKNPPSDLEKSIMDFHNNPSYAGGALILSEFTRQPGARVFRQEMLRTAIEALNFAQGAGGKALSELFVDLRDKSRARGRRIPNKAVGSTLLFKGLEAEVSIILEPETMDAHDLYVSLTRGSRRVVVCSTTPVLPVA